MELLNGEGQHLQHQQHQAETCKRGFKAISKSRGQFNIYKCKQLTERSLLVTIL